ncbi:MAG: hypothetical protein Q7S12_01865 [bacterium]|nr:hypothetical protein [bacterium]
MENFRETEKEKIKYAEMPWEDFLWDSGNKNNVSLEIKRRKGFDVMDELHDQEKLVIEVAGLTDKGFNYFTTDENTGGMREVDLYAETKVLSSNLYPGAPNFDNTSQFTHFGALQDFIADSRKLPIKSDKIDALFCSSLGEIFDDSVKSIDNKSGRVPKIEIKRIKEGFYDTLKLKQDTMKEAYRVLKDQGLLVWQGVHKEDIDTAERIGFTMVQSERRSDEKIPSKLIFKKEL